MPGNPQADTRTEATCPKCGGPLASTRHTGGAIFLGALGGVCLVGSIVAAAAAGDVTGLIFIPFGIVAAVFYLWRARYWARRTTLRCAGCRYFRVVRG